MEEPTSISDSGATITYNTVFVDTSLDTHLAMIVSGSDTVSDLKSSYTQFFVFPKCSCCNGMFIIY